MMCIMCYVYYVLCVLIFFLFFKQKTAYEMRISDWSSDVCSSDLQHLIEARLFVIVERLLLRRRQRLAAGLLCHQRTNHLGRCGCGDIRTRAIEPLAMAGGGTCLAARCANLLQAQPVTIRSEEHTSELQSLMRISYAVFCLKKKKKKLYNHRYTTQ